MNQKDHEIQQLRAELQRCREYAERMERDRDDFAEIIEELENELEELKLKHNACN